MLKIRTIRYNYKTADKRKTGFIYIIGLNDFRIALADFSSCQFGPV